ncbi:putative acetyltransferase [Kineococcus xinjiangensis]|uniref:Putative acetyltransferase n=1 Tax=Kineococcus xinjiangensis TaxID=512762 RepID=A0A2S6IP91_9ACTN|nr:GNAT family N-acetyltransferase [Kineococcus xinjiangensis]PPK96063.1 putative acetyltransferase [Kineococcus xinjiangensis]
MTPPSRTGSPAIEVVDVDVEDTDALTRWSEMLGTAFMEDRPDPTSVAHRRERLRGQRLRAGAVEGRLVASLRSFDTELTLPGGRLVGANAVSSVAVLPTHRRRGLLSALMRTDLRQARERGAAVSVLIASEAPIYGRYGFGAATECASWTVDADRARFRGDAPRDGGALELVDAREARADLAAVHDRVRRRRAGELLRDEQWWNHTTGVVPNPRAWGPRSRTVLRRGPDGVADGYCTYTPAESWQGRVSRSTLTVHELSATTPAATRALWEYCTSVDWVRSVRAEDRPVDELLPWLLEDPRAAQRSGQDDFLWVRILDTAAVLRARSYRGAARLVLRVHDDAGPAAGTVALETGAGGAEVAPTDAAPDVELTVDALAALLLGGTSATTLARAGRLQARDEAVLARAADVLGTGEAPWCATSF